MDTHYEYSVVESNFNRRIYLFVTTWLTGNGQIISMDKETEIRRRIYYVTDLIQKSDRVIKGELKVDYYEYYQNYQEVVEYLNRSPEKINNQAPELIKPNIFNRRLGGLWTLTALGLLNPFFATLFSH
jgi:hypothetical protein